MKVKAWHEKIIIPTYAVGAPEPNPVFIENRVYQGSTGKVYPHPVIESIADEKIDKKWNVVFLENDFLKIMIMPELGGRIQMAYDKMKKRHFVYYNQVIKPALVGLTGPWISGGIEFNWPQHHRPSTFDPIEVDIEKNEDGSQTVWCNEVELMFRTKAMIGFTLYPGKAYLELKVKLYNRTVLPQSFLWWANPAVKVNDHYQSVFPPDVHAVYDHGKRDVSDFPIATGTYYKVDYSPATDISRYKNIPVPTSYMAVNSNYDFVGGYENDTQAGLLHVANHHISPGKKQWTWGHSDFGRAWDRNLTDEDGPYIELMCGVFTDNQPDFSWIMPFEERSFKQYFMPYRDIGVVKNASKDVLINLEFESNKATIKVYTTAAHKKLKISLTAAGKVFFEERINTTPKKSFGKTVAINKRIPKRNYELTVVDKNGNLLLSYQALESIDKPVPEPAKPANLPHEIKTTEELYLRGLHLEQYRHATYNPVDYYQEALKREPRDIRNNNALGLWLLRNGQFEKAAPYFRTAIASMTALNPNPYDGEAYFNLGQCLKYQGKLKEAYGYFYKATWNAAWQGPSFFCLAQISCWNKDFTTALALVEKGLICNWHNHKARGLKAVILHALDQKKKAQKWIKESLQIDRFNITALHQSYKMGNNSALKKLNRLINGNIHTYIEYALDYANAGLLTDAILLLEEGLKNAKEYPMAYYFLAWFAKLANNKQGVDNYLKKAKSISTKLCFPYRLEAIAALESAIQYNPKNAKAAYYLANLWYDKKNYELAIDYWEKSKDLNPLFPTVHRNLSLAYFNKRKSKKFKAKALSEIKKAFELNPKDARVLLEYDQLRKRLNHSLKTRLKFLNQNLELVNKRDDLYLERISIYNQLAIKSNQPALHKKALELLMARKFHPWEGGEGKVTGQFLLCHVELAKHYIKEELYQTALVHLNATEKYPTNLGEGKLFGAKENDIFYWKGLAYTGLANKQAAQKAWKKAAEGKVDLAISIYYNDQQPDQIFYQALALIELGKEQHANMIFSNFIKYGKKHQQDKITIDYFAVSLPDLAIWDDDLSIRNRIHCLYLMGLGNLGLNKYRQAESLLQQVIKLNNSHSGAAIAIEWCKYKNFK